MSLLVDAFREKVGKSKDLRMRDESGTSVGYSTGFLSFDFRNGTIMHGKKDGQEYSYYSVGIADGSLCMWIGRSGCGKTTMVLQSAGNIIRPFPQSAIFHDDIEGGISEERKQQLTGLDPDTFRTKYIGRNKGITAENFYERVKMIHDIKLENPDDYLYDTGYYDIYGEKIFKMQPTVYILDSLAMLMPEKYSEEDELSGQMAATAVARANASIFKRIIPMLKAANIILFVINHITEAVDIGVIKKKSTLSYLKQGESLPGGRTPGYLSNNIFRMDDHSKLVEGKEFDIDGTLVTLGLVKSRSNKAGQSVDLVFNQEKGFDYDLSLLLLLKNEKRLKGAGAHLKIEGCDISFAQRQFKDKLATYPELQEAFANEVSKILKEMVYDISYQNSDRSSVTDNIFNKMNEDLLVA